ncbi:MAG: DEAD/DEAH box helicase family protein, partial [Parcubacteria group bacterium]|nr:DEAD/DEAH box helicase family protein [Parcubacteria group bacterium]
MPQFLYQQLDGAKDIGMKWPEMPGFVVENLNPDFTLREYQKEAFGRFFHCFNNDYEGKEHPLHLLFNMATGSGKTLIMAGLILYLYERGHRNFLFFVNSTNIIEKTRDNFLNDLAQKYLFRNQLTFDNRQVAIKSMANFDGVSDKDINICFTTIQKLHTDLYHEKENSLTFADFKDQSIVLIADEAHHGQVKTKQQVLDESLAKPNWENTVEKIFKQNPENLLLEFTATMDFSDKNIVEKYRNKIIYKYELKDFRNDGFSKDVELLHTDTDKKERIIQAIILSQYRQEVATKHGVNLKPVILFKAQKTIAQSEENKKLFHEIIDGLSAKNVEKIKKRSNVEILQKAFAFFENNEITSAILIKKLKDSFAENKTLSVNEEKEKEKHQILLNSLEDKNNQIRAIFAVQKLNEGWDVLNLFDIVRLYETRDGRESKPGKTTISEAQLIGRGARYYPFVIDKDQDKYKRKFDKDLDNELRILEELHYHSHNESRYIAEIKNALVEEGMLDENEIEVDLYLKDKFKKSQFYKSGLVYANEKKPRTFDKVKSIKDLGVSKKNIEYNILSGQGEEISAFDEKKTAQQIKKEKKTVSLAEIAPHIIKNVLAQNDFYTFASLHKHFPQIKSVSEFIKRKEYLADLAITFCGNKTDLEELSNENLFQGTSKLLEQVEMEIKNNLTEYEGTEKFIPAKLASVFVNKKIKVKKDSERLDGQEEFLEDKDWYVFNANYGTA